MDNEKTKREMKNKLFALLLLSLLTMQGIAQTRFFLGGPVPATKPPKFSNQDIYRDTVNFVSYRWYNNKFNVAADQLTGNTGLTGPQGPQGIPGTIAGTGNVRFITTFEQFEQAIADMNAGQTVAIIQAANITQTRKIKLPPYFSGTSVWYGNGFGWLINVDTAFTKIYSSLSGNADRGIDSQFKIYNVLFQGSAATKVGFYLQAQYGGEIIGCRFKNIDYPIYTGWCMNMEISRNRFWNYKIAITQDYARLTGGGPELSASNHPRLRDNIFRSEATSIANIRLIAVSGAIIDHNIHEGVDTGGGDYYIDFDYGGSNTVKEGTISNEHIEQSPKLAAYRIRMNDGYFSIIRPYVQKAGVLISADGNGGYPRILVENVPWLTSGTLFESKTGGVRWSFTNMPETFTITSLTRWVGGVVPANTAFNSYDASGMKKYLQGYTIK